MTNQREADADWEAWDRQLERDVADGKLDELAAEALAERDTAGWQPAERPASGRRSRR